MSRQAMCRLFDSPQARTRVDEHIQPADGWIGVVLLAVALAVPLDANGVACPTPGAKVRVCVNNPTSTPQPVYVAGTSASNEITCTGPAPILGGYQNEFVAAANTETCKDLPETGGLVTGMYIHRIYDSPQPPPGPSPTPRAAQYQKGPVVGGAQAQWSRVDWTFHKTILTVNSTADSSCSDANCQAASCTLRQAINKAGSNPVPERPVLINFNLPVPSTIQLTSTGSTCGMLRLDKAGADPMKPNVTIDGTDSSGRPWIVGDRSAFDANQQDTFPVVVDLKNTVRFQITKGGNTIKGLHVKKTVPVGAVQANEVFLIENVPNPSAANEIRAVKIDGGNTYPCTGPTPPCDGTSDGINVGGGSTLMVKNVEVMSALDKGIKAFSTSVTARVDVLSSWLHHNYRGNAQSNGSSDVSVSDSVLELAGRRASDNASVTGPTPQANGVTGNQGRIYTARNVIERNRASGLVLRTSSPAGTFNQDVACGNGGSGIRVDEGSTGVQLQSYGVGAIFNGQRGVQLASGIASQAPFAPSHAFVNNQNTTSGCDFDNLSSTQVDVNDSQWTRGTPRPCGTPGKVVVTSVQDRISVPLSDQLAAVPSNLLLQSQTVRILGSGFNAVEGNAPAGSCTIGDNPVTSCCKQGPQQANVCPTPGKPPTGGGQCVEIVDRLGIAHQMTVEALNPSLIVTSLPADAGSIFPCFGRDAVIRVVKIGAGGADDPGALEYCTNDSSIEF